MTAIAVRLQSFGARIAPEPPPADPDAGIARAYQEGYELGLNRGRETSLDALCHELVCITEHLHLNDAGTLRIRRALLEELRPVLLGLVDLLGCARKSDRLLSAIGAELDRVADNHPQTLLHVRCTPDMHDDVADCIARAGLSNAEITIQAAGSAVAEIRAGDGRIILDSDRMLDELRAVIADIFQEE